MFVSDKLTNVLTHVFYSLCCSWQVHKTTLMVIVLVMAFRLW